MILRTQPNKPWSEHDFLLLEAYQILEDERCPKCGLPRYVCENESNEIQFHVREASCAASVAISRREKMNTKAGVDSTGVSLRPEPYSTEGRDLVSYREPYYRALSEKLSES